MRLGTMLSALFTVAFQCQPSAGHTGGTQEYLWNE